MSVSDVHDGLEGGLRRRGAEVINYHLEGRWEICYRALNLAYKQNGKARGMPKPTDVDVAYWASQGVLEKAIRHQPDWIIVVTAFVLHPQMLFLLKRAGFRVAILHTESPYDDDQVADRLPLCDVCWTNERSSVESLRKLNPNVYYLPHAYDPTRHNPYNVDAPEIPSHDVVFVGTLFQERIDWLESVNWDGIDFGLYGTTNLIPSRSRLRRYVRAGVQPNAITAVLYKKAKIGLNLYRTSRGYGRHAPRIKHAESLNPRQLELAACGLFSISDYRAELAEVFGPLVPTFDPGVPGGLERVIRRWLSDDEGRNAVTAWLPAAVLGRTFDQMAAQVVEDLTNYTQTKEH